MKTVEEQRASLHRLVTVCTNEREGEANYGVLLMLSPPGDVSFLAPVAPKLRGVEIVSASAARADGKDYDIWRKGHPILMNLTAGEVREWLRSQCLYTEAEYKANIVAWTESLLRYYRVPERRPS